MLYMPCTPYPQSTEPLDTPYLGTPSREASPMALWLCSRGSHRRAPRPHMPLVEWVWQYYSREPARQSGGSGGAPRSAKLQSSAVIVSGRPPLYFQHQVEISPKPCRCTTSTMWSPDITPGCDTSSIRWS